MFLLPSNPIPYGYGRRRRGRRIYSGAPARAIGLTASSSVTRVRQATITAPVFKAVHARMCGWIYRRRRPAGCRSASGRGRCSSGTEGKTSCR